MIVPLLPAQGRGGSFNLLSTYEALKLNQLIIKTIKNKKNNYLYAQSCVAVFD